MVTLDNKKSMLFFEDSSQYRFEIVHKDLAVSCIVHVFCPQFNPLLGYLKIGYA